MTWTPDQRKTGRPYTRHSRTATLGRIKLKGFAAIDMRSIGGRETLNFRNNVAAALGGIEHLSPQKLKLLDLASRASLMLDHIDEWILTQDTLIDNQTRTILPIVRERQVIASHLMHLLDKLGLERRPRPVNLAEYYDQQSDVEQPDQQRTITRTPIPVDEIETQDDDDTTSSESDHADTSSN
jgi:hypothetical protein